MDQATVTEACYVHAQRIRDAALSLITQEILKRKGVTLLCKLHDISMT
jgi:hypothetical protein